MTTHSNRSAKLQTIYLWRAWQSEPGMNGAAYTASLTDTPPRRPQPAQAYPGLVYQESLYDDWELVGTCTGHLVELALPGYADLGEMTVENRSGQQWDVESIIRGGRYRKVRA